jgi:acetoin utilization deacetylase AcuC-like enzyme
MTTALITHPDCLSHFNPDGHPERVARLQAVLQALERPEYADLLRVSAPLAQDSHLHLAHPQSYVDWVRAAVTDVGFAALDADTTLSPGSLNAALRAVGANIRAVDLAMQGNVKNAFCAIRPPGHHAETATAMGFCIFSNVAIAAKYALAQYGLERVAILDFDVHHGNGTQDLVWGDPNIAFVSTHQTPLYPGSGSEHEQGSAGNVLNLPLPPYSGSAEFRRRIINEALPFLTAFAPQMLFISAGFDAHFADPLANMNLSENDFAWITQRACDIADAHCQGRIVSTLEGGYDLDALAASTAAHVRVLMERGA